MALTKVKRPSASSLSALVKRTAGRSFSRIFQAYRLSRASLLLANTALSTQQVAPQMGYQDLNRFYKA